MAECLLNIHKALVGFLALHKSGLVSHDKFHPRLEEWKEDQKFKVILGYTVISKSSTLTTKHCLKPPAPPPHELLHTMARCLQGGSASKRPTEQNNTMGRWPCVQTYEPMGDISQHLLTGFGSRLPMSRFV